MAEYIIAFLFVPGTISISIALLVLPWNLLDSSTFFLLCDGEVNWKKDGICHEQDVEGPLLTAINACLVDGKPTSFKGLIHFYVGFEGFAMV